MRFRSAVIAGHGVRILRMGMGGSLSYEVHGFNPESAIDVYNEIISVGRYYGIVKLGLNQYYCNHTENGFPQIGEHFPVAAFEDADYLSKISDELQSDDINTTQEFFNSNLIPRGMWRTLSYYKKFRLSKI